ncbi:hypothetical protein P153DRAFT_334181 [Dothidotthia symphoricarpi CBS 119687]|uniref:BHLH domain-containing protein n=1 Tax=Dothidotthia symphoricarpi CBS 119687 TaxID=1392245 RepID=A0A6A6AK19_9PLEO|nr:uncharacterized protein P153DRAFT_334181 [Dothidotthia symphoricarpi CBS 119687]KAF2131896.1 hypothetical protein P153DRAFT_334181 [Dothidotthia symphoricarpi CBS 119687]
MNAANAQPWAGAEHFDQMDATAEHDFGNLIDFDHLDLDFNIDYSHGASAQDNQQLTDLTTSIDVQHLQNPFAPQISQDRHNDAADTQQTQNNLDISQVGNGFFDYGIPQYGQSNTSAFTQAQEHVYRPHHGVPPTPNSIEMHGDPHRYLRQMDPQQALFDQRYHMRKDDATFTPLVSPAVTPHDARFQIPDFTVPGAYFSPLTSPALTAQSHQHAYLQSQATASGSSTGHSPVNIDMDVLGEPAMVQSEQSRKLRSTHRRNVSRTANASSRVRQSPIVKPGRRRTTVTSLVLPKEISALAQEAQPVRPLSNGLEVPRNQDRSETDSISPEPMLSDMRPPPLPSSVTHSPAILAQHNGHGATPATPASLMRIQPSPEFSTPLQVPAMLDDLILPESSLENPSLSLMETAIYDDDYDTPRLSARKTPKMGPHSTPGAAMSSRPSPMLDPMSTPTSPAFSMTSGRKTDLKIARNPKKRNSVSSSLVSPALRPKISPSIKPLLPDGGHAGGIDTHALLLASKSNYQNILDGTTVPGVVYPTSLSTNLTSKRTSHKIAEQGRRNRINTALQEMQALLPPSLNGDTEAKSPEMTAAQSNNSKAAKVESAIDYIRLLKKQCEDKDRALEVKEREMDELREQLAALRRCSSVGTSGEEAERVDKDDNT